MTLSSDLRRIADWFDADPSGPLTFDGEPASKCIRRAADALEWRRVEDGLPANGQQVLACGGEGDVVYMATFLDGRFLKNTFPRRAFAWMQVPLPPSPERARE